MRTRCPACQTVFRVSTAQLHAREGKVRCGNCHHVFNALDTLDTDRDGALPEPPPATGRSPLFILEERPARDRGDTASADDAQIDSAASAPDDRADSEAPAGVAPDGEPAGAPAEAPEAKRHGLHDAMFGDGIIPTALFMKRASAPEPKSAAERKSLPTPMAAPLLKASSSEAFALAEVDQKPQIERPAPRKSRFAPTSETGAGGPGDTGVGGKTEAPAASAPDTPHDIQAENAPPATSTQMDAESPKSARDTATDSDAALTGESRRAPKSATHLDTPTETTTDAPALEPSPEPAAEDADVPARDEDAPQSIDENATMATAPDFPPADRPALAALDDLPGERPANALRLSLIVGVLIAVLAAQTALIYRKAIAQDMPSLRPFITALCANLGCSMALPRDAGKIRIEISDLNRLPDRDDAFVLSTTLRNESAVAQAYPHLELTLTNALDRAVARRVFTPQEWLPADAPKDGFGARKELEVSVSFMAEGLDASGYRLYVFHP